MENLIVKLIKKNNPYKNNCIKNDDWGEIIISYGNKILLDWEWGLLEFIEWFNEKKGKLAQNLFPQDPPFIFVNSIAESRDILYSVEFSDEEINKHQDVIYLEKLANYFSDHHFHLRGTLTPSFYIGLNIHGKGEISYGFNLDHTGKISYGLNVNDLGETIYVDNNKYCSYIFNMSDFINTLEKEIKNLSIINNYSEN
ncbi:hypothetical protein [Stenoxybacter acetivorans]|uniref:hypothetical protein n=1 Tax=Stenoxybacter acetivorans TaxID=422441 RepID=UPI0005613F46|nr:hypothetical protein [Stenoxybacter acetivorans]